MLRPRYQHAGVRRTIKREIYRLGMHARSADVVAVLATRGIDVSAGQVERLKLQILKDQCRTAQARHSGSQVNRPRTGRRLQKVPQKRPGRK